MFQTTYNSWFNIVQGFVISNENTNYENFIQQVTEQIKRKTQAIAKGKECFDKQYILDDLQIILEKHVYDEIVDKLKIMKHSQQDVKQTYCFFVISFYYKHIKNQ